MSNKKRWIAGVVLILAAFAFVVVALGVVGFFIYRGTRQTAVMPGATAVGEPTGAKISKSLGPAGGTVESPDGAIVVAFPPNALTENKDVSILPITNLANGGVGSGYRLEPSGSFAAPVKITIKLADEDLAGSPTLAFQDAAGTWQAFTTADIDQANKTVSVQTTHFTDFAGVTYKLNPDKATLKVGESINIKLIGCRVEDSLLNTIQSLFTDPQMECSLATGQNPQWSADFGTVAPSGVGVKYTAPARKPPFGTAEVVLKFNIGSFVGREVAKIKIVEPGYAASGVDGPNVYSGKVCDLNQPFNLTATNGPLVLALAFTPSSGTATAKGTYFGGTWSSNGSYTISGAETETPVIIYNVGTSVSGAPGKTGGAGVAHIHLTPFTGDECGGVK